ncbi:MAG: hypothetical protein ACLR71_11160 [[Clostridium] scindens]
MLFPYCKDYLRILLLFAPASMLQTLFQNLTVTAGRPSLGLSLSVGAGIINIILDYLLWQSWVWASWAPHWEQELVM